MVLPPLVAEQMARRPAGRLWLVTDDTEGSDLDAVAETAGLGRLGDSWIEIDADQAQAVVAGILHRDLAYRRELVKADRAARLAREFVGAFDGSGTRFATNTAGPPGEHGSSWTPATDATFDAGVIVLGPRGSAVFWVADED